MIRNLKEILEKHQKWVIGAADGKRADLYGADLSRADLSEAEIELELINKFYHICCPYE